jgi:hypothetical protein
VPITSAVVALFWADDGIGAIAHKTNQNNALHM